MGAPDIPDHVTLWGLRFAICQPFDQYANVRPARLLRGNREHDRCVGGTFARHDDQSYIHAIDRALIMAADTLTGYIDGLLDGKTFRRAVYNLDRKTRRAALERSITAACSGYSKAA